MKTLRVLAALSLSVAIAACAVEKSETPLSPTIAGPMAGVQITAPKPLEPSAGARIPGDRQPVTLLLENASSNGPRPLTYVFEVATEPGFANRVFAKDNVPPGDGGRTSLQLTNLTMGRVYYWRAKALDGANESPFSNPVDFNVYTPVSFDKPAPISPVNNNQTANTRPTFAFSNAPRDGSPTSVSYVIEISTDSAYVAKVAVWQLNETPSAQQSLASAADLPAGVQLFWHVRAFESPVIGPWSDTAVFRTPAPIIVTPTPSPTPAPGGSCSSLTQPFNIVKCRRDQFAGHMSNDQVVVFEKAVASDLNKSSIGGGPYGLLRKSSGASCGGYACDIICAGDGNSQRQWDILGDSDGAQTPAWNGPNSVPNIRVDKCDVF